MTGLERDAVAGELVGEPGYPERGMPEHASGHSGLLDLGILVHDAADPAQVDVKRTNRAAADDNSGGCTIIRNRIEDLARVLQPRVDDLYCRYHVFGRAQHLGKTDTGPFEGLAHDE